jgi:polyisoprenoid-binding protein YceI
MRTAILAAGLNAAALLAAAPSLAAEPWTLDKSHAAVTFRADHLGFSVVHGVFREFDAEILFDPEDIEATEVSVTIDAASVDTFWEARDQHLRGADFLDVDNHPEITFISSSVEQTGEDTATVTGDMTLVGETREVTFEAKLNKLGPNPFNQVPTAGFTLTGEIVRADFGITYGGDAFAAVIPVVINVEIAKAE